MIKKIQTCIVSIFIMLTMLPAGTVSAGIDPLITNERIDIIYPYSIAFYITASSDEIIKEVRLYYTVERISFAEIYSEVLIESSEQEQVDVGWYWDFRYTGGLPPGTVITYWWTVEDTGGDITKTTPQEVTYDDNRYTWDKIRQGNVTIYWYEGSDDFAEDLMEAAQEALLLLEEDTGSKLKEEAEIYVYENTEALRQSLVFAQEWTGGVAYPDYNTIAIGIAPSDLTWGKRAIVHELAHLVTSQTTANPYNMIPTWLNEGISMYAEGKLEGYYQSWLDNGINDDSLISIRSLASPFSALTEKSYLSYAESYSIIEFLIEAYGQEMLQELLVTFAGGSGYDEALQKVYGFDMDGLNNIWQYHMKNPDAPFTPLDEIDKVLEQGFEDAVEEIKENGILILITILGIAIIAVALSAGVFVWRGRHE